MATLLRWHPWPACRLAVRLARQPWCTTQPSQVTPALEFTSPASDYLHWRASRACSDYQDLQCQLMHACERTALQVCLYESQIW